MKEKLGINITQSAVIKDRNYGIDKIYFENYNKGN